MTVSLICYLGRGEFEGRRLMARVVSRIGLLRRRFGRELFRRVFCQPAPRSDGCHQRPQGQDLRRQNGAADLRRRPQALQRAGRHDFLYAARAIASSISRTITARWTIWRRRAFSIPKPSGRGTSRTPTRAGKWSRKKRPSDVTTCALVASLPDLQKKLDDLERQRPRRKALLRRAASKTIASPAHGKIPDAGSPDTALQGHHHGLD